MDKISVRIVSRKNYIALVEYELDGAKIKVYVPQKELEEVGQTVTTSEKVLNRGIPFNEEA